MGTGSSNSTVTGRSPAVASTTPTSPMSATVNLVMTTFGFLISAIFIVFVLGRLLCARLQNRRLVSGRASRNQGSSRGALGMDPVAIALFPTVTFSRNVFASQEDATCAICLGEYEDGDFLRILPQCGHTFNACCIDAWLRQNASCPICRIPLQRPPSRRRTSSALLNAAARSRFIPGAIPESLFEQPLPTLRSPVSASRDSSHFALHVRRMHGDQDHGFHAHIIQLDPREVVSSATQDFSSSKCQMHGSFQSSESLSLIENAVPCAILEQDMTRASSSSTVQSQGQQDPLCRLFEDRRLLSEEVHRVR